MPVGPRPADVSATRATAMTNMTANRTRFMELIADPFLWNLVRSEDEIEHPAGRADLPPGGCFGRGGARLAPWAFLAVAALFIIKRQICLEPAKGTAIFSGGSASDATLDALTRGADRVA